MARSALTDYLQVYPFWLFDVAPIEPLALPIFTPLSGFSSITAPEITVDLQDIKEGNWHFKRTVIKGADVSPITLTRGATFANSDFWRWIVAAITGDTAWQLKIPFIPPSRVGGPSPRRQLVLVHFFSRNPLGSLGRATQAMLGGFLDAANAITGGLASATNFATATAGSLVGGEEGFGLPIVSDAVARIPARAFVLYGCLPTRYKTGGDFDARSGEISIAELDIKPELVEEIGLTS